MDAFSTPGKDDVEVRKARTTIEQGEMTKALYRFMWEAAHQDDKNPRPMPLLTLETMRHEIADALGIRRIATK